MTDETQNQSSEEQKPQPSVEDLDKMSVDDLEKLATKAVDETQDQEEEKSSTPEQESKEDQPAEGEKEPEPLKEDTQEKTVDWKLKYDQLEKSKKELEAEFTRRSQELSQLKKTKTERSTETGQDSEPKSPLEQLAETNPAAKVLVEAIRAEMEAKLNKGLQPVKERLTKREASENISRFQEEVQSFLGSPLKGLEKEFNDVAARYFENQEALLQEAAKDPALFTKLKKEVLAENFEKAAGLVKPISNAVDRVKEIAKTGVTGKARTGSEDVDRLDFKVFKNLTVEEMEKELLKRGVI